MIISLSSEKQLKDININNHISVFGDVDIPTVQGEGCVAIGKNSIATGSETSAITDNSFSNGEGTIAGTHAFRMISGDLSLNTITLSNTDGIEPGMLYSVRIQSNYDCVGRVLEIVDENTISVSQMPGLFSSKIRTDENLSDSFLSGTPWYDESGNGLRGHDYDVDPLCCFTDRDDDTNILWIVGHPELGEISSYATGAFSQGYHTMSQMQYSHSEGLYTIASGKYSHAEGYSTIAGYAAHSEGYGTNAIAVNAHAEGNRTYARGMNSHAEGIYSQANGYGTHADGLCAFADSSNSYVWNGWYNEYHDNGVGTFNISPKTGLSGFYVADKNMFDHIEDVIKQNSFVLKILHDNKILASRIYALEDGLSAIDAFVPVSYDIAKLSSYADWFRNRLAIVESGGYTTVSAAVVPGEELSVSNTNLDWYAGYVGLDEKFNRVCSWDFSKYYMNVSADQRFYFTPENKYGLTEEILNGNTSTDNFHWLRKDLQNVTYLSGNGNNTLFTVPENCYYIVFSSSVKNPKIYRHGKSPSYIGQQFTEIDKQLDEIANK